MRTVIDKKGRFYLYIRLILKKVKDRSIISSIRVRSVSMKSGEQQGLFPPLLV